MEEISRNFVLPQLWTKRANVRLKLKKKRKDLKTKLFPFSGNPFTTSLNGRAIKKITFLPLPEIKKRILHFLVFAPWQNSSADILSTSFDWYFFFPPKNTKNYINPPTSETTVELCILYSVYTFNLDQVLKIVYL